MTELVIRKLNEVHSRLESTDRGLLQDISDKFTFDIPNAKFMPKVRAGIWDGKIRLFNRRNSTFPNGLIPDLRSWMPSDVKYTETDPWIKKDLSSKIEGIIEGLHGKWEPKPHQRYSFQECLEWERATVVSPTGSGKSYTLFLLSRYLTHANHKVLVLVPFIDLVTQLGDNFDDFNRGAPIKVHRIAEGASKDPGDAQVVIATWQSIYKKGRDYFDQFDVVMADECHLFKSKNLTTLLEKCTNARYRFGFTGTLWSKDNPEGPNEMTLKSVFGPIVQASSTRELMDAGHLSPLKIKAIVLSYPEEERKLVRRMNYQSEIDYIVRHPRRNKFVVNLVKTLKGNTLVLFRYVEKHGKVLYELLNQELNTDVFFIAGGVPGEERKEIRKILETHDNAVIVASIGTTATGVDMPRINNVVFTSPTKSRITNLQSIGRGLRTANGKLRCTLYDIADDFRMKNHNNTTLRHFAIRLNLYKEENFDWKLWKYTL